MVVFVLFGLAAVGFALMMYSREKQGKPIFVSMDEARKKGVAANAANAGANSL